MPTYEFRCPAGHQFDRLMKMSESVPELPCPECGETALRQMSGGAGLVFKGSGFYLTDYGRNAHRTSGPLTPGSASSGGESKSSGGSEGKSSGDGKSTKPSSESKSSSSGSSAGSSSGSGSSGSSGGSGGGK
jgi:putative FmdB family regulatory protein